MTDQGGQANSNFPGGETFVSSTAGKRHAFRPGEIVDGSYQLLALLGHGGMGVVFSCRHSQLNMDYAIKLLNGDQMSQEHWGRFQAEAQALARLNHPGIVRIHNMGIDGGQYPYYVMDLLSGETLDQLLRQRGHLDTNTALDFFIQVADGLHSAHQQGIIHRDIKPANLMLVRDNKNEIGAVKIVDFGIARLSKQGLTSQSQTATGTVFGTPFYMSPEQCQGLRVDQRSDIYSLGCALYETLTGKPPFCGENAFKTFMLHQTAAHASLSEATGRFFPESLEAAITKMLAKNPQDRYQNLGQLKVDLERIKAGKKVLSEGLAATITAPDTALSALERRVEERKKAAQEDSTSRGGTLKIAAISTCLLVLGLFCGGLYFFMQPKAPAKKVEQQEVSQESTPPEVNEMMNLTDDNFAAFPKNEKKLIPLVTKYLADPATYKTPFKRRGAYPGYKFPDNFILGAIQFGDEKPFFATGFVPEKAGLPVTFYLTNFTEAAPQLLDNFGPDDLTGLEIKINSPKEVIKRVSRWHRLKSLCFFNSLIKALPEVQSDYDESDMQISDLKEIDKLKNLTSLGLCGPKLNGPEIMKMKLLSTLRTLRIKRIKKLYPLLQDLSNRDNIHELWLIGPLEDAHLLPLTRMKNLEVLRIRRSDLTPQSLTWFKQMHSLKRLYLDRSFKADALREFKSAIPGFEEEPTNDYYYWKMFPTKTED